MKFDIFAACVFGDILCVLVQLALQICHCLVLFVELFEDASLGLWNLTFTVALPYDHVLKLV